MTLPDPALWARLSAWFDELMELDGAAREARLLHIEHTAPDAAAELRRMLAANSQSHEQGFLSGAATPLSGPPAAPTLAGQRLGAYVLEAPIGQGGSGSVWRARREDGRFEAQVAIKLLHLSLVGQAGAERFRREGSILARLTHPHIARLLDAGITPEGQPYLVIELVRGERLDRHCNAMNLDTNARLRLYADVLQAVAHAHGHLVVHRDIKPSNILVTPQGVVKLLDFGIAKLIESEGAAEPTTDLTRDWGRVMTPEYAAPEQLRGDPVTTGTDVYALGALLYELLTGQLPFPDRRRGNARAWVSDSEPPRPSTQVADATLRRRLAGDLDTIVMHTLKAHPAERYATVRALLDDINRHLSGHPVLVRGESWHYSLRKWVGRNRAGTAVGVGVALALVGGAYAQVAVLLALAVGTLAALWQARRAQAQAAAAQAAQRRAEEVKQFIASIFTEAKPREGSGGVVTAIALLQSATQRIETELASAPATAGELGVLIGQSCSQLGYPKLSLQALDAAVPRCQRALGNVHPTTLGGRVMQLEAINASNHFERTRALAPALLEELRAQLPVPVELLVDALRETSFALAKFNDAANSLAPLREAVDLAENHLGPLHEKTIDSLGLLSNTLNRFAQHAQALKCAQQAMDRTQQALGGMRPHTLLTQCERWYVDALRLNDRPADAEVIARQVVVDQRALDGDVTLRVVNAMAAHTMALAGMGRTEEAVALARDVVNQHAALYADAVENSLAFAYRLAFCLLPTRRLEELQTELERGDALQQQAPTSITLEPLRRQRMWAQLQAWRGDSPAARALLDTLEAATRDDHPLEWARLACVRAMSWRLQGEWQAGLAAAHEAIARCTAARATAVDRAHAHTELGLLLLENNRVAEASASLDQAELLYQEAQVRPSLLNADALLGRGRLHRLAGRRDLAQQVFNQVQSLWARSNPGSRWHREAQDWVNGAG